MKRLYLLLVVSVALFLPETVFANENANDSIDAQIELALKYIADGDAKGFYILDRVANRGDAESQFIVGYCYAMIGQSISKSTPQEAYSLLQRACYWYQKAALQGNAVAQYSLGRCYFNGDGVGEDTSKAVYWFRKAAEQGNADAQLDLGACYAMGTGVTMDLAQSVYWHRKAAEQGDARGQLTLGLFYRDGTGVEKNLSKAKFWLQKAANQGLEAAQSILNDLK